jgi:predicted phage baseplate assembly protein
MSIEFDFLPNLPKPNLDDRSFKDLVDECILRIPRYCPEWTNFNPGDPGITMVELFAWLTDQMLLRFNQVPRRNYVVFLEMLGIRLLPPSPAQTELTFYLTAALPHEYEIAVGTEVATIRTESQEAIAFSTDTTLTIGQPQITHMLTAKTAEVSPQILRDRLTNIWTKANDGSWEGRKQSIFEERPSSGNCFYFVFSPEREISGNVLAVNLRGEVATSTGINPDNPPRSWEAWNGMYWQPVLLQESDDGTHGFSFNDTGEPNPNTVAEADVILHLPKDFPVTYFATYQGRWLRCVYKELSGIQSGYSCSPQLIGFSVRAIGGTVDASQCNLVRDELLGNSDGTPGQKFQLQNTSILPRQPGEHIIVIPPAGLPEIWQEVNDFASSGASDRHYTLDSLTGQLQFGPLIREPAQMRENVQLRTRIQVGGNANLADTALNHEQMERQYGAIPQKGASIRMGAYRAGGGRKGNVQTGTVQIPKSAIPYVERVINHVPARNGADAESLEDAVMRVPRILRTRDRAVTPEDFETLTLQATGGGVARVCCPRHTTNETNRGIVDLLIVPQGNTDGIYRAEGINPTQFAINSNLRSQILDYLDERRLLGVQIRLQEPEYVGVAVQAEVGLEPEYTNLQAQQAILRSLQVALYRFLNPLTGGIDGKGWQFGASVYPSDIVNLFQQTKGVRYLGTILLFELRKQGETWTRSLTPTNIIDPGTSGLICSWADSQLRSGHAISVI